MTKILNIGETLKKYRKVEIDLLLAHVLKKSREFLFMHPNFILTSKHLNILTKLMKRRLKGESVAYILGYKDFMGYRFKVNRDVLIPRPETEGLVERIRNYELRIKNKKPLRILDIGTGSGCIAISLAKLMEIKNQKSKIKITASDISQKALKVAKANARANRVKIKFIHSDILKNLRMKFDIIVANLPYVPKKIYNLKFENLKFEPKSALVDPDKDFNLYERLFKQLASLPFLPKAVFLEIDPSQKLFLSQTAKKYLPGADIKFYRDFNNFWRYAEIVA